MFAIFAKAIFGLFITFSALIGVVQAGGADAANLEPAFEAGCEGSQFGTCFLGIRPGQTTLTEAITILHQHEWVVSVTPRVFYDYYQVAYQHFAWRDPRVPDAPIWRGELIAEDSVIDNVRLESEMMLGELWGALGSPGIVAHQGQANNQSSSTLLSYLFFTDHTMLVSRSSACPISYHGFLMGEVNTLEFRDTAFALAVGQAAHETTSLGQLWRELRRIDSECS